MIEVKEELHIEETVPKGKYFTMQEYADLKGMSYNTVRKKVSIGRILSVRIDNRPMIPADLETVIRVGDLKIVNF